MAGHMVYSVLDQLSRDQGSIPDCPNQFVEFHYFQVQFAYMQLVIKFQFKVHTTILGLTTPAIDWSKSPTPLTGLPEDVLHSTLYYMYAECLPRGLSEETAKKCVKMMSKIPELNGFVKLCDTFLQNTALQQRKSRLTLNLFDKMSRKYWEKKPVLNNCSFET